MSAAKPLLEAVGLEKRFDGVTALKDFHIALKSGEIVGLMGPNGAGKTTLFDVITGFLKPDRGQVLHNQRNITGLEPWQVARIGVARTFQQNRLIRQISIEENIRLSLPNQLGESLRGSLLSCRGWRQQARDAKAKVHSLLEQCGLEGRAQEMAGALSYGEEKLLSLSMCMATDAELVLLDEPVSGVSMALHERIAATVKEASRGGRSFIVIEHNVAFIRSLCSRLVFMDGGTKVCEGDTQDVLNDPRVVEAFME